MLRQRPSNPQSSASLMNARSSMAVLEWLRGSTFAPVANFAIGKIYVRTLLANPLALPRCRKVAATTSITHFQHSCCLLECVVVGFGGPTGLSVAGVPVCEVDVGTCWAHPLVPFGLGEVCSSTRGIVSKAWCATNPYVRSRDSRFGCFTASPVALHAVSKVDVFAQITNPLAFPYVSEVTTSFTLGTAALTKALVHHEWHFRSTEATPEATTKSTHATHASHASHTSHTSHAHHSTLDHAFAFAFTHRSWGTALPPVAVHPISEVDVFTLRANPLVCLRHCEVALCIHDFPGSPTPSFKASSAVCKIDVATLFTSPLSISSFGEISTSLLELGVAHAIAGIYITLHVKRRRWIGLLRLRISQRS